MTPLASLDHDGTTARRHDVRLFGGGLMLRVGSPLSEPQERLVASVIDCGFAVHRGLGPGFREKIYKAALCLELDSRGLRCECEKRIEVKYNSG
jgi:PD-(D/E)XK nuclease superfamily